MSQWDTKVRVCEPAPAENPLPMLQVQVAEANPRWPLATSPAEWGWLYISL